MEDAAPPVVIEIARLFLRLVLAASPNFDRAYLRCQSDRGMTETKGSYVEGPNIEIIDAIKSSDYFKAMGRLVPELFAASGKERGVLLLTVDKTFDYNFEFDWNNLTRWKISKLNGGTGVPEGVAAGKV
jgi:hypothetical protein